MTKHLKQPKCFEKRLLRAVAKLEPVPDSEVTWMRKHRPSRAMLMALGSGPWKIGRRFNVQTNALSVLGLRDISSLSTNDIEKMFPLDWQRKYLSACVVVSREHGGFDWMFRTSRLKTLKGKNASFDLVQEIHFRAHGYWYLGRRGGSGFRKPIPKVLSMFVRDFLYISSFPVDRHVRKWLKKKKLPTNSETMLELFNACGLHASGYARALFMNKSSNPDHPREGMRNKLK